MEFVGQRFFPLGSHSLSWNPFLSSSRDDWFRFFCVHLGSPRSNLSLALFFGTGKFSILFLLVRLVALLGDCCWIFKESFSSSLEVLSVPFLPVYPPTKEALSSTLGVFS